MKLLLPSSSFFISAAMSFKAALSILLVLARLIFSVSFRLFFTCRPLTRLVSLINSLNYGELVELLKVKYLSRTITTKRNRKRSNSPHNSKAAINNRNHNSNRHDPTKADLTQLDK